MEEKLTQSKNKLKCKISCRISSILYIHTKLHFIFFFSLFKNRFCKHCFRSFRYGLSTYLLQSVRFSIENSPRLLLWHLQVSFPIYSSNPPAFIPPVQLSTHSTLKPQKEKKLEELSGSSGVVMFLCGCEGTLTFSRTHIDPILIIKKGCKGIQVNRERDKGC